MGIFEAIILGLVQGLTEFIPISSSGHLILASLLFGNTPEHLFLEFINIGTVLALIIYFWDRIKHLAQQVFVQHNWRLARNIFISALPAGLIGLFFADFIEKSPFFASAWVVIVMLLLVGILLIVIEKLPRLSVVKGGERLNTNRAFTIGLAQVVALIPGTSRSGSTIIAGRMVGLSASAAAEYSFLVSIPLMLGVIAKVLLTDQAYLTAHLPTLVIGNIAAFISGFFAVGFLMRYLAKHSLALFGWYRIILAVAVAGLLLLQ